MGEAERVLVTGGAGYIGSHLVDSLVAGGREVAVLDNLSAGRREFLDASSAKVALREVDLLRADLAPLLSGCGSVVHAAANPDVRLGATDPAVHFEQNVLATSRLLQAMDAAGVPEIVFLSTSAVYGDAATVPTPEHYAPMRPISLYGASKLAAEHLVEAWARQGDRRAVVFRFANVVGGRATHGVIVDFVRKLRGNPRELEILGAPPGTSKSYVHIEDTVAAILAGWAAASPPFTVFNVASGGQTDVAGVADAVCRAMGVSPEPRWTGGVDGGRGWKGDVRNMALATDRLRAAGWRPRFTSDEAVAAAVRDAMRA
jgi:UDP-glucose 4-epimerase